MLRNAALGLLVSTFLVAAAGCRNEQPTGPGTTSPPPGKDSTTKSPPAAPPPSAPK